MDKQVRRLRAAVAALGERKRGRRIPLSVRELAVAYATRRRSQGMSWSAMSRESGVSGESLRRWTQAAAGQVGSVSMVPVTVQAPRSDGGDGTERQRGGQLVPAVDVAVPPAAVPVSSGSARSLVLVSPRGYRLEGLALGEARLLLEVLS